MLGCVKWFTVSQKKPTIGKGHKMADKMAGLTVKGLIEELKKLPQYLPIILSSDDDVFKDDQDG